MDNIKPQKSNRLVSFTEFTIGKSLKPVFLAGFKRYAKTDFMTQEKWEQTLKDYQNR